MSYTPTEWQCGDTITAEKMNKIEQGIANSGGGSEPLIVNINRGTGDYAYYFVTDKTFNEIYTAMKQGRNCIAVCEIEPIPDYYSSSIDCVSPIISAEQLSSPDDRGEINFYFRGYDIEFSEITMEESSCFGYCVYYFGD